MLIDIYGNNNKMSNGMVHTLNWLLLQDVGFFD